MNMTIKKGLTTFFVPLAEQIKRNDYPERKTGFN